eukprot:1339626-Rhodomonas_salina.1
MPAPGIACGTRRAIKIPCTEESARSPCSLLPGLRAYAICQCRTLRMGVSEIADRSTGHPRMGVPHTAYERRMSVVHIAYARRIMATPPHGSRASRMDGP